MLLSVHGLIERYQFVYFVLPWCCCSEQHHRRWHLGRTIYDVLASGAVGDGRTNDTQAFFTAWNLACATANGVVHAPAAYTFLVYPATFEGSKCQPGLQFLVDGTIVAPDEVSAWGGVSSPTWLVFEHVTNFSISGTGTFNGQGKNWWKCKKAKTCKQAPTAVEIHHGTDVTVENVTFLNSQQIHLNLNSVVRGQAKCLTIVAPPTSPNTDGIHVSACTNTTIQNCNIATGDDCISIVSGSDNIEVENVYCGPGCHGISIGSLGENGATANVSQVQVKNCVMEGTTNGLRIKTWQGGKGLAYNFVYQNISMINVTNPIIIDQYYCPSSQSGPCSNSTDAVQIELVKYTNITGTSFSSTAVSFQCSQSVACTSIHLQDISLQQTSGGPATSSCTNARGVAVGIENPLSCLIINNTQCATTLSWLKSTLNNLIGNKQPLLDKNKNNTKLRIYLCIAYTSCLLFATYWVSVLIFKWCIYRRNSVRVSVYRKNTAATHGNWPLILK
ncbi:unnamed protein product [Sphagnum troendelagicum]|uniref:Polygalacturonase n=1 Tax=Sphagnum troendelagicum TaxID=128251 RepID=A0ABP0V579_9BRYO